MTQIKLAQANFKVSSGKQKERKGNEFRTNYSFLSQGSFLA